MAGPVAGRSRIGSRGAKQPRARRVAVVVFVVLALQAALAGEASAHVTLSPSFVSADEPTTVSFAAPNERPPHATVALSVTAPAGVEIASSPAPSGWALAIDGRTARWSGGTTGGATVVSFPVRVTARTRAGNVLFRAEQSYDDGAVVRWEAPLTVLPATGENTPAEHPGRALIAALVGIAVLACSLLVVVLLRRRALQEQ